MVNASINPLDWLLYQLEHYLFGSKLLLGIGLLVTLLFGLMMGKMNKVLVIILLIPMAITLSFGGYLPAITKVVVYTVIAIMWVVIFIDIFLSK